MMVKYRVLRSSVEAIEVIKETKVFVTYVRFKGVKECKESKHTDYQNWFDTWEEAKAFMIDREEQQVAAYTTKIAKAKSRLAHIRKMEKPPLTEPFSLYQGIS